MYVLKCLIENENNMYNDTLNAKVEFFFNKFKINAEELYVDQCGVIQISIEIITISTG